MTDERLSVYVAFGLIALPVMAIAALAVIVAVSRVVVGRRSGRTSATRSDSKPAGKILTFGTPRRIR